MDLVDNVDCLFVFSNITLQKRGKGVLSKEPVKGNSPLGCYRFNIAISGFIITMKSS